MSPLAKALELAVGRIESATWVDPTAARVAGVGALAVPDGRVKDALSGTWLGHPLHPLLVSVPIGAWTAAVVLDLRGRPAAARDLIGLGLVAAVPTALTGLSDWLDTEGAEKRVGLAHAAANYSSIALFGASYVARGARATRAGRGLALVGTAALAVAGWLGGHLAYAQGVGVDTTAFQGFPTDWTDVAAEDEVGATPTRVDVDGTAILLATDDGRPVALADRCTHRGAPLHEGQVEDGCVVCPWHGSRFALATGQVTRGPAVRPQPTLEVRVRAGRVQVRRAESRSLRTNPV